MLYAHFNLTFIFFVMGLNIGGMNKDFEKYHRKLLGRDYDKFISSISKLPKKSIRVNTLKITKMKIEDFLKSNNIKFSQIPWCDEGLWIDSEFELDTVEHQLGYYYIQTSTSMIPPIILEPNSSNKILDLTAAPGSKTTQIAQYMQNKGTIVANEGSYVRIRALVINLQRCGVSNTIVTRQDGCGYEKFNERFDKILLDAPCSDIGTAGKNPNVIRRWSIDRIRRLSNLQKKLIASAYLCLKNSGILVYSTCTTSKEENEGVVEFLLNRYDSAEIEEIKIKNLKTRKGITDSTRNCIRILPQDNDTGSYFIAKVRKNA